MSSLKDALAKAMGCELAPSTATTSTESLAKGFQKRLVEELSAARDISRFRSIAKRALAEWPDLIDEVIEQTQRFGEPGEKLGRLVESLKSELATVSDYRRERFLKKKFQS